ncbi:putative ATPase AAA-type core domain-containing protein [Seiridium unicorne]|uniref:ATPase AAA-type core domain-containing protein n=1 Tax=Seiridium unicorne TaxID=138068 RepID=A0ABR2UUW1_9PEZI
MNRFLIGNLGTSPKEVEDKLQEAFHLAKLWNCVLLLDEVDVFLAQRSEDDIQRNALVSAKLTKSGLIDLNHKEILDYAESFFESQQKPGSTIGPVWNGRQIRNAFQGAVALAGYKKQGAHKIVLTCEHFKKVLNISSQFNNYLQSIQNRTDSDKTSTWGHRHDRWPRSEPIADHGCQQPGGMSNVSSNEDGMLAFGLNASNAVHGGFQQGQGQFNRRHGFTQSQQPQLGQQQQFYQQQQQPTSPSPQVQPQFSQSQPQTQQLNYRGQEQDLDVPSHGQPPRSNPLFLFSYLV